MKVKQTITRREVAYVDVELPVYVQHDVGDGHTYIVTHRYELQSPHVPTFLVSSITESDDGFEFRQASSLSIDIDIADSPVTAATWNEAVESFAKWSAKCLDKMRGSG